MATEIVNNIEKCKYCHKGIAWLKAKTGRNYAVNVKASDYREELGVYTVQTTKWHDCAEKRNAYKKDLERKSKQLL